MHTLKREKERKASLRDSKRTWLNSVVITRATANGLSVFTTITRRTTRCTDSCANWPADTRFWTCVTRIICPGLRRETPSAFSQWFGGFSRLWTRKSTCSSAGIWTAGSRWGSWAPCGSSSPRVKPFTPWETTRDTTCPCWGLLGEQICDGRIPGWNGRNLGRKYWKTLDVTRVEKTVTERIKTLSPNTFGTDGLKTRRCNTTVSIVRTFRVRSVFPLRGGTSRSTSWPRWPWEGPTLSGTESRVRKSAGEILIGCFVEPNQHFTCK